MIALAEGASFNEMVIGVRRTKNAECAVMRAAYNGSTRKASPFNLESNVKNLTVV